MRLRNVPGSRELIADSRFTIKNETEYRGTWNTVFGNDHPLHIEIGMGKVRAIEKQEEINLPNLFFIRMEAENIAEVFEEGEVERIYLNFSDPWPKDRHAKRRLTSMQFLERYEQILKKEGHVIFKTDNRELFDFSMEQAMASPRWEIFNYTFDLHHSEYVQGNVMTEYETKFVEKGNAICRMEIGQKEV